MISIILGTRPEIIKMSPVIRECEKRQLNYQIIHTGQHYSYELDEIFFKELELPPPGYNLNAGSGTHAEETGKMLIGIEKILLREKSDTVLVEGDTNTVLAGALAASKLNIKIGHVEAGLRSYDRQMPEEINRIIVDHISDCLFAPTENARKILLREGIPKEKIFVTGNTIVDSVCQNVKIGGRKAKVLEKSNIKKQNYFLLTLHRAENVDVKKRIDGVLKGLELIYKEFGLTIIFPSHPRTENKIRDFGLKIPKGVRIIKPLGFLEFLELEKNAKTILTDSGGVQEEACILRTPCVTLRDNTERPETLEVGSNTLAGGEPDNILNSVSKMINKRRDWRNPFGDGKAGERIINIIKGC